MKSWLERIEEEPKKLGQSTESIKKKADEKNQRYRKSLQILFDDGDEDNNIQDDYLRKYIENWAISNIKEKSNSEDDLKRKDSTQKESTQKDSYSQAMSGNFMIEERKCEKEKPQKNKNNAAEFDFGDEFAAKNPKKRNTNHLLGILTNDDVDKVKDNIMKDLNKVP